MSKTYKKIRYKEVSKINEDNNESTLNGGNEEKQARDNVKATANKVKNSAQNKAKKVLQNKKVRAFILAHLPLIIGIVIAIILIIFLMGIIMLLITMPGLILGKLDEMAGNIWGNFSGYFTGDSTTAKVSKQEVLDLAQYMENMGYDIQTYGLGEVTYKDDGKGLNNRNGKTREIEKIGETVDGKNYLQAYIAADENTYVLAQYNVFGAMKSAIDTIFDSDQDSAEISDAKTIDEASKEKSTGMINVEGYDEGIMKTENSAFVSIDRNNKQMIVYTNALKPSNLLPARVTRPLADLFNRTIFGTESVKWGNVFRYDLDNWSARYGRPKELLLAIHLSTMMPDLAYQIATSEDFNTKVNIGMEDVILTFDVDATKADDTLKTEEIVKLFLNNCLGTGDVEVDEEGEETGNFEKNDKYNEILSQLDEDEKNKFFKQIWQQIENGVVRQFTDFWGINFLSAEAKANGDSGIWESISGKFSKIDILDLFSKDSNTYIYLNESDDNIPGTNWTYNEIINLAELAYKGNLGETITDESGTNGDIKSGVTGVKWPFIRSVTKHWYYTDIDFTKNAYRVAKTATKTIDYIPEDKNNPLKKDDISIKLNATLQADYGVIYQVCEPEADGPNNNIIKAFEDEYYAYDGSALTAKKIANTKAIEINKSTYKYNGEKYSVDSSDDMKAIKKKVNFEKNKTNTFSAFSILGNMHTEAADYIYRNLKELVVKLGYFSENELQEELKQIVLWPIKTDNQYAKWETSKDENNWGETIKCNSGENTVVAPSDAIVEKIEGDSITLKFTTINDETIKLYNYIYNKRGVNSSEKALTFTKVNEDILNGMKITISNIDIDNTISEKQTIYRGQTLGQAKQGADGNNEIKITMQNIDKSIVEDLSDYFTQEHNTKYEEIIRYQMNSRKIQTGIDIGNFGSGYSDGSDYSDDDFDLGSLDSTGASGTLSLLTTTSISKSEFVKLTKEYAEKNGGKTFADNAEALYDVCVKNNINPVWCAAQARIEQNWVTPIKNNYWGLAVYNNTNTGTNYNSFANGVQGYCNNIKTRLNSEKSDKTYTLAWSKILHQYDDKHFHGKISSVYDVFSNYAVVDNAESNPAAQAKHASNYVNNIIKLTNSIYGKYGAII